MGGDRLAMILKACSCGPLHPPKTVSPAAEQVLAHIHMSHLHNVYTTKKVFISLCVCQCECMWVPGEGIGAHRAPGAELEAVVICLTCMLGPELGSSS